MLQNLIFKFHSRRCTVSSSYLKGSSPIQFCFTIGNSLYLCLCTYSFIFREINSNFSIQLSSVQRGIHHDATCIIYLELILHRDEKKKKNKWGFLHELKVLDYNNQTNQIKLNWKINVKVNSIAIFFCLYIGWNLIES